MEIVIVMFILCAVNFVDISIETFSGIKKIETTDKNHISAKQDLVINLKWLTSLDEGEYDLFYIRSECEEDHWVSFFISNE